jgi:hypothetical protein
MAPEALLHRPQHHVLNRITIITTGAGSPVQRFTVTAVHGERDPQFLTVITTELEAVRTPPAVAFFYRNFAFMSAFVHRLRGFPAQ